ncbi:hypothetical protein H310_08508 [Aphanomyces invadans]|uniref:DDE Tnp4 domain-containing protein n=1 Tax=Aphanomyces invadans TaxID=157072 RepID=A0A024TY31_9STRA|nr:hypothetical protein H310_08508 [Aphanomyces invadans]ETV99080.1 hypothetical protein H310_08508 [Aphanomyces invadans]|eukprot:XP_008872508.1 hypothetical protein H310_08508 [Aphanomyces invadans]
MKAPTLEKMIHRMIDLVEPVQPVTMTQQIERGRTFSNFPSALYCTDVKFQPSYRPTGRFDEAKHYYSGKHKLYGLKLEYSVAYPGVAVDLSKHTEFVEPVLYGHYVQPLTMTQQIERGRTFSNFPSALYCTDV